MPWYQIFQDGPEFEARRNRKVFTPPNISLKLVREAVPQHLFLKSTPKSVFYISRHLLVTLAFFLFANWLDQSIGNLLFKIPLWILYSGWQGMAFAGIWCLGMPFLHS
jgi:omega-6 fatty acid desaturase (delta-12 desaturase)